ncbi:MAG: SDR family NAD(P)-dependent oxidoreductase [Acidobacteria bacterium]|nr:MAG: SDR family NAD(P)-dependent oxidoreductase [Acidobacteriota bacterium]REK07360.1 MAG: SDR family NAD(P)-dependent oxidoreductase [Acidobacteriota bacterium]
MLSLPDAPRSSLDTAGPIELPNDLVASRADPGVDALVVGASGGIGAALVAELVAAPGVGRVFAWSRRGGPAPGGAPTAPAQRIDLAVDLRDDAAIEAAAESMVRASARPRLVFVACGRLHDQDTTPPLAPERRLADLRRAALEDVFTINAWAPLLVARAVVPLMPRRQASRWVSLSARVGSIGDNRLGGWYAYRASKAALNQLHRCLAIELRRSNPGATCLLLHPGTVDTPLSEPFQSSVPDEQLFAPGPVARRLLELAVAAEPADSGGFFAWDGQAIPW